MHAVSMYIYVLQNIGCISFTYIRKDRVGGQGYPYQNVIYVKIFLSVTNVSNQFRLNLQIDFIAVCCCYMFNISVNFNCILPVLIERIRYCAQINTISLSCNNYHKFVCYALETKRLNRFKKKSPIEASNIEYYIHTENCQLQAKARQIDEAGNTPVIVCLSGAVQISFIQFRH